MSKKATYVLLAPPTDERDEDFVRAGVKMVENLTIVRLISVDEVQGTCEVRIPQRIVDGKKVPAETAIVDIDSVYGRAIDDKTASLDFVETDEFTVERIVEVQANVVLTANNVVRHRAVGEINAALHRQDPKVHQYMIGWARAYATNTYIGNALAEYLAAGIQPY